MIVHQGTSFTTTAPTLISSTLNNKKLISILFLYYFSYQCVILSEMLPKTNKEDTQWGSLISKQTSL